VAVRVGVNVATSVAVGGVVCVGVAVAVDVGDGVSVAVAVWVGVSVGVDEGVSDGVAVAVGDEVAVGVLVGVGDAVSVGVAVGVRVAVGVWLGVAVWVGVGVMRVGTIAPCNVAVAGCGVFATVLSPPQAASKSTRSKKHCANFGRLFTETHSHLYFGTNLLLIVCGIALHGEFVESNFLFVKSYFTKIWAGF
jgi:hypothetical protein